ncbi:MAG: Uma2 family endonuclease [Myxococcaceae bacterium]|nr:MAG: Uma2 family endonuclease [Myxococcaceae bacterium]
MDAEFPNLSAEVVAAWRSAPDHVSVEIVDGELFTMPRPGAPHASAATDLVVELGPPFARGRGGPGGWVILVEPELHLGAKPDIVHPDIAGWRRERMPLIPDTAAIELAPDWVCEVLSEGTEAHDRGRKMRLYRRAEVAHYWLVDPRIRLLEIYRLEGGRYTLLDTWEGDATVRAEPFDAIELDLSLLWAR